MNATAPTQEPSLAQGLTQAIRAIVLWWKRGAEEVLIFTDAGQGLIQRFQTEWQRSPFRVISSILAGPKSYPLIWANIILTLGGIGLGYTGKCPIGLTVGLLAFSMLVTGKVWLAMKVREIEFASLGIAGFASYELGLKPILAGGRNIGAFLQDKKNDFRLPVINFLLSAVSFIISDEQRKSIVDSIKEASGNPEYEKLFNVEDLKKFGQQFILVYHAIHQAVLTLALVQAAWLVWLWQFQPWSDPETGSSDPNFVFGSLLVGIIISIIAIAAGSAPKSSETR